MFTKLFNIPFYQTHWQDIPLVDIFKASNQSSAIDDNSKLYDYFYERFTKDGLSLKSEFIAHRNTVSNWLESVMSDLSVIPNLSRILSIGAGFGIIEASLIKKKYNITMQECQDKSVDYMKKFIPPEKFKFIKSKNLNNIEANSFDFIYAYGVCYSMTLQTLNSFLAEVERILVPQGIICIAGDAPYAWSLIKSPFVKHNGFVWGWRRPWQLTSFLAKKNGLQLISHAFLGESFANVSPKKFLGIPLYFGPYQDFFLFRKR